uniref:Uncharacterized protein n=1 Tax=Timema bartmani TaxID=61472 RepID=A0A7R9EYT7_9NEOP|nr:unnamed protein product [Timema bartmani]
MDQWPKTGSVRKRKLTETPNEVPCTSSDTDWTNKTTLQQVQDPVPEQLEAKSSKSSKSQSDSCNCCRGFGIGLLAMFVLFSVRSSLNMASTPPTGFLRVKLNWNQRQIIHPTEIRTSISLSSKVWLNTTSALANYATEAGCMVYMMPYFVPERNAIVKACAQVILSRHKDCLQNRLLPPENQQNPVCSNWSKTELLHAAKKAAATNESFKGVEVTILLSAMWDCDDKLNDELRHNSQDG